MLVFSSHLLSAYNVPGTILGTKGIVTNKADKNSCSQGVYILVGQGVESQKRNTVCNRSDR